MPKITTTSGSLVASHQVTLWKQANRILDVATSNNIERASPFWFLSRNSKIVAWVGGGAQDHSNEWIKGRILPFDNLAASKPNIGRRYQPQRRTSTFWFLSPTSEIVAWVLGRGPRSQPCVNQGSYLTIRHSGSKRAEYWTSLPATRESLAFLVPFTDF